MEKSQVLQNIAKKGKVEVSTLEKELAEIIAQMPPSDNRENLAFRELNNRYSGPPDKTNKYDICMFGLFNLTDFNRSTREASLKKFKNNQEAALESGEVQLIDGQPIAIDLKKTFGKDNIPNGNYGKPLGYSFNRNTLVLVREEGSSEWVIGDVALRGDFAKTSLPKMYTVLHCNLLGSIADGLKSAKSSKFTESDEKLDYANLVHSLAKDKVLMLGDVFEEAKKHSKDQKGYYQRFVITGGDVKFINDPKVEGGNYNGVIDDFTTNKMVTVFIDGALGKPDVGSTYTMIVQSSIGKEYDRELKKTTDEDKLILNVLGYYA